MQLQNLSKGTIDDYLYELRKLPNDEEKRKKYLAENRDKRMLIAAYRKYIRFQKHIGKISTEQLFDLLETYKPPKRRGRSEKGKWFPQAEWGEVISNAPNRCAKMGLWLGFSFGLRLGEIINLRVEDIDLTNEKILVRIRKKDIGKNQDYWHPKHFRDRSIPIPPTQKRILERWIDIRPALNHPYLLWTDRNKNKVSERVFQRWCKIAHPELKTHDLRRSFANALYYNSDKNVKLVSDTLGHANIGTTSNYLGLDEKEVHDEFVKAMS